MTNKRIEAVSSDRTMEEECIDSLISNFLTLRRNSLGITASALGMRILYAQYTRSLLYTMEDIMEEEPNFQFDLLNGANIIDPKWQKFVSAAVMQAEVLLGQKKFAAGSEDELDLKAVVHDGKLILSALKKGLSSAETRSQEEEMLLTTIESNMAKMAEEDGTPINSVVTTVLLGEISNWIADMCLAEGIPEE